MMANIEKTALWADIKKIFNNTTTNALWNYTAIIHTKYETFPVLQVLNIDESANYLESIGDTVFISFVVALGDYVKRIYPFKDNMELTIRYSPIGSNAKNSKAAIQTRYKVVFLPNENKHYSSSELTSLDKDTIDHMDLVTVKLQLLDRSLEPFRIKNTFGIYRNITPETLMRSVTGSVIDLIKVDGKKCIDAIDIYKPNNDTVLKHIVLPSGTLAVDIPKYLQNKICGIYNSGLGNYLQTYNGKKIWFIYPLFYTKRFTEDSANTNKMIFYFVPSTRYAGIDKTFYKAGNVIKVACTSDKQIQEDGEAKYMDSGVGFSLVSADTMMGKPVSVDTKSPMVNPAKISTSIISKSRDDGLNYAPMSNRVISSNPYPDLTLVAYRNCTRIDLVWNHSDPSLIFPGMSCQLVYLDNNVRKTLNGIIIFKHTSIIKTSQGMNSSPYTKTTAISIMAERPKAVASKDKSKVVTVTL